jgi:acetyl esterase/lipase
MANAEDLTTRYESLLSEVSQLKADPGLCAAVYTQITDVENELNGLLTYDRAVLKVIPKRIVRANRGLADPQTMLLWPSGAPGAKGDTWRDKPTMTLYWPKPATATGAAIVICPGGGYGGVAIDHEGHAVARWLNSLGVAAMVVDYRHSGKGYRHPAPLQDGQRAVRIVRSRAQQWGIDPQKIGILGFSAGGHLAATVGTLFDQGSAEATDPVERVSCRPDFMILCYPVIAFNEPYTHRSSQDNLIGPNADAELIRRLSPEKQVTAETPPVFLWHTAEDWGVSPENSVAFFLAACEAKVPAELHIYEKGGHGLGLAGHVPGTSQWTKNCEQWMRVHGFLTKPGK